MSVMTSLAKLTRNRDIQSVENFSGGSQKVLLKKLAIVLWQMDGHKLCRLQVLLRRSTKRRSTALLVKVTVLSSRLLSSPLF